MISRKMNSFKALSEKIHTCTRCPRLRRHCEDIAKKKRRAFSDETYWGRPVSGFGDPNAELLIVGLAPAAHGANRTGRIFTGDQSGFWLYRALFENGYSNLHSWESREDGLILTNTWITCAVRCAPPQNKPDKTEFKNCSDYLQTELELLTNKKVILILGKLALDSLWPLIQTETEKKPPFQHGAEIRLKSGLLLLMSYHPSQQNTFTKKLTHLMFDQVIKKARRIAPPGL